MSLRFTIEELSEYVEEIFPQIKDDFEIITGNSEQMKNLVKKICNENGFRAETNWNGNPGSLLATIDRL